MPEIPQRYRDAVRAELDALVKGERPDMLTWVRGYGPDGANLVDQPEDIWSHAQADCIVREDGSASIDLPLWTTEKAPSDLTAQFEVAADGGATLHDVHVL